MSLTYDEKINFLGDAAAFLKNSYEELSEHPSISNKIVKKFWKEKAERSVKVIDEIIEDLARLEGLEK